MLQILLHSSKTMSAQTADAPPLARPVFGTEADKLVHIWREVSAATIKRRMHISDAKAAEARRLFTDWSHEADRQVSAIDAFRGDIYSGLQVADWSPSDRKYAHEHLVILSGLYGALRACDGIMPYRLEMGYKLPRGESMYSFWGDKLAGIVRPETTHLLNLSAVEYTKALLPYIDPKVKVVTPKFMTISPKTGQPTFVTVHAKIARGAFARWVIQNRAKEDELAKFNGLGYQYDTRLSSEDQPVFVCKEFKGLGLSVRPQK